MKEVDTLHIGLNQESVNLPSLLIAPNDLCKLQSDWHIPNQLYFSRIPKMFMATWTQRGEKLDWKETVVLSDIKMS